MPLSGKTRIEFFIPCIPNKIYKELLLQLQEELTYTFGGCTVLEKVEGWYESANGKIVLDVVNILFTDVELSVLKYHEVLESYFENVRDSINKELNEEAVLITANSIYHFN